MAINAPEITPDTAQPDGATPDATPEEAAKPQRSTITVATNVPLDMKELLDKAAEAAGKTTAVYVRELLANSVSYTLPVAARKTRDTNKYVGMTDEQKKAAVAKDQQEKRQKAAALLAALEAGDLDVDLAAILAKYKPAERAPRAAKPEDEAVTPAAPEEAPAAVPASA